MSMLTNLNTILLTENIFSYLILLVLTMLVLVLGTKFKYGSLIAVPFGLVVGIYYLSNGLGWHFLLLLFASMGVMDLAASRKLG